MTVLYTNNAETTISASITNSQTSLSVASGKGALFPSPAAGDYFYATLVDSALNYEVVKVTARSVDTMTVVRGQDGTTARAYSAGDKFELRIVRALLDDLKNERVSTAGGTITTSGSTNSLTIQDTGVNGANIKLVGNGATTPNKTIRAFNGNLSIVNNAYSAEIFTLADDGTLSVPTLKQGTNQVVHAGNVSSYAPTFLGSYERSTNAQIKGSTTGAMGLLGIDSSSAFRWNIYGDGTAYGFLDSVWGNWDVKKTINSDMQLRVSGTNVTVLTSANYGTYVGAGAGSALPTTGGTLTGTLNFNGTGLKITGDFSNATLASRLYFQTNTANSLTSLGIIPNGTATTTQISMFGSTDVTTNYSLFDFSMTSTEARIRQVSGGTGAVVPVTVYTSGTKRFTFGTAGQFGIGTTPDYGTSGYVMQSNGSSAAPSWVNPGTFNVASANYTTHLYNGAARRIPYQTAASTTAFITDPNGYGNNVFLRWNGSSFDWASASPSAAQPQTSGIVFGTTDPTYNLVSLGYNAASNNYGIGIGQNSSGSNYAVAIGNVASGNTYGVAVGASTSATSSTAIGPAITATTAGIIALRAAADSTLWNLSTGGFYVDPITSGTATKMLYYDTTTKKVTYGDAPSGSGSSGTTVTTSTKIVVTQAMLNGMYNMSASFGSAAEATYVQSAIAACGAAASSGYVTATVEFVYNGVVYSVNVDSNAASWVTASGTTVATANYGTTSYTQSGGDTRPNGVYISLPANSFVSNTATSIVMNMNGPFSQLATAFATNKPYGVYAMPGNYANNVGSLGAATSPSTSPAVSNVAMSGTTLTVTGVGFATLTSGYTVQGPSSRIAFLLGTTTTTTSGGGGTTAVTLTVTGEQIMSGGNVMTFNPPTAVTGKRSYFWAMPLTAFPYTVNSNTAQWGLTSSANPFFGWSIAGGESSSPQIYQSSSGITWWILKWVGIEDATASTGRYATNQNTGPGSTSLPLASMSTLAANGLSAPSYVYIMVFSADGTNVSNMIQNNLIAPASMFASAALSSTGTTTLSALGTTYRWKVWSFPANVLQPSAQSQVLTWPSGSDNINWSIVYV